MHRRTILVVLALALTVPAVVQAAPNDNAACRQAVMDAFVAASEEKTMGDFMSDFIFGNEPNQVNGQTVPSQSPGPFVNTGPNLPPRNDRVRGITGGQLQELVRAFCG